MAVKQFERKRMARNLAVPTDDTRVRARLRELGEPITLFGEGPGERRDRLREILVSRLDEVEEDEQEDEAKEESESEEEEEQEEFFTYGVEGLLEARHDITQHSISRAKERLSSQRRELVELTFQQRKKLRHEWYTNLKTFETQALQYGDERPLSYCAFTPDSKQFATASWSGVIKLWQVPECAEPVKVFKGHKDRVSGFDFHPDANISQPSSAVNMVSGAVDGSVHLWSLDSDAPVASLEGHELRVARVAFHPSGRYVGTASFDTSWRLWDVATQQELLFQEGHSREVFAIGFQPDGALCATAGMDAIGRVWDIRTGRSVMVLQGHVKHVLCLDWSPNGYQLVTGGEDNTLRVWDMRAAKCLHVVPAHKNLVTQVKYWHAHSPYTSKSDKSETGVKAEPSDAMDIDSPKNSLNATTLTPMQIRHLTGSCLVSSSYDGTCKIWTDGDFKPVKTLTGLEGKVVCCDISADAKYVGTASWDRTFKMYAGDN
ncbi:WD40-repeat-containing domain protein [Gaertneriomyces semiglobifer]|nr:WD40-repeat-containing domain protein [Gaertneriomyces semiglobifer]